ncbi:PAS domain-containing protein [Caulobacter hibisci]|uniref:histidine kinase n=1 Tax=Caulobacter hibisci TaxID=2035993 RepID=A0ABS0SXL9_9CAUL|nr:PAS domain-containing protein [Caulobacter hibisci]MBI1684164.1 PAS domain-containing protein [Caulobacter hibisci]
MREVLATHWIVREMSLASFPVAARGDVAGRLETGGWSDARLGSVASWPTPLRQVAGVVLNAAFPMFLVWGDSRALIYNDAYRAILGEKHPWALGQSFWDVWPEVRDQIEPVIDRAFAGEASVFEDLEVTLLRAGRPERAWFTFSYSPVPDDHGVPGVLCVCVETTSSVLEGEARQESENTLLFLDRLTRTVTGLGGADAVMAATTRLLGEHLGVAICAYADMDEDQDGFTIRGDWSAPGSPSIIGHYSLADFGQMAVANLSRGEPLVINDNRVEIAPHEAATFQAIGIGSTICMPLRRDGRLRALMAVHHVGPHSWTERELALVREVTERSWAVVERVGAEAELRKSEAELRRVTDAAPLLISYIDADQRYRFVNHTYEAWFGQHRDVILGRTVADVLGEGAYGGVRGHLEAALTGERVCFESHMAYPDGGARDIQVDYVPRHGEAGEVQGVYAIITDITSRLAAERALLESETRLRLATENAEVGLWDVEGGDGALYWDDRVRAMFGVPAGAPVSMRDFYEGLHPDDRAATSAAYAAAADPRQRALYDVEYRTIGASDGVERWVAAKGRGVFDEADRCQRVVGTAIDISARKHAEGARDLLIREVDHRARNSLAVIQSVVKLTKAKDPEAFRQALQGRIESMARAQSALAESQWRAGLIGEIVRNELFSSVAGAARLRLAGGQISIPAEKVQPLSMILHELATNATKYGALSAPAGVVDVRWSTTPVGWSLNWQERGGPPVAAPERRGFGSRLMNSLARQLHGVIIFDWAAEGLSVELRVGSPE